jgi:DNA-binding NarL/FixJ family response regulator
MIRIIIVSDKDSERNIIQESVDSQTDISIVGQGRDGYDALRLVSSLKPNIAMLDDSLPMLDGVDITPTLKCQSPETKIIILTSFYENFRVLKAISGGASGYLLKNTRREKIIAGIRTVYENGCLMTPEIAAKAFKMFADAGRNAPKVPAVSSPLSRQELQVVLYIAQGFSNKKISSCLALKEGTIRNYITAILGKINRKNRTQIAVYAYSIGLISGNREQAAENR